MTYKKHYLKLLALLVCLFSSTAIQAVSEAELMRLEADMLNYIGSNSRDTFYIVSNRLKDASKEAGNDRLYYKAWSKQAMFEATHQNYAKALEIVKALSDDAEMNKSVAGQYFALHSEGAVLMQKDDYQGAEQAFLKALSLRHEHFPNESAAEDLRELMKLAYQNNDIEKARRYAHQLLEEPNLTPHHKGRTLYRLSILAFDEDDAVEFNQIYDEMKRLMQTNGIRTLNLYTEVNHHIINGEYKEALRLTDLLSPDTCAERKALIYHRMGNNDKAYEYMALYKHICDSLTRVSHNNVVSNLYLRMNNDRLRLEREVLKHQNNQWHLRFYLAAGVICILVLLFLVYKGRRMIKGLRQDNMMLNYGKEDAERAIKDLNELSFYESKTELPLTSIVSPNKLCNHLASNLQNEFKNVTAMYQTDLPDDFTITTNAEALEALISHLLKYSARFTFNGTLRLSCAEMGDFVRFSVTDTSAGLNNKPKDNFVGMFSEHGNVIRYVGMNFNICQSITRLLHGRIWRDIAYTNGTRFCFEIPKKL